MIETPTYKFALREDLKEDKQFLPAKAEPNATGWDVRAAMKDHKPLVINPFEHVKIPLGFRGFCPDGWWYTLVPRSSSFAKKNLHCLYGMIDFGFEGELLLAAQYIPNCLNCHTINHQTNNMRLCSLQGTMTTLQIEFGEAIGQIIPVKRQEMIVEELDNEYYNTLCQERQGVRGAGGFGSTS